MTAAPKVVAGDGTATPATVSEKLEAVAGRLLGIQEDTPEPDEHEEVDAPEAEAPEAQPDEEQPEADAEPEELPDADADDAEDEPEADDPADLHTVKIDGKEEKVKLDELKAGYSRHRDYTVKTQKLAEERKALETELTSTREARTNLIAVLEKAELAVKALAPEVEPDWTEMEQTLSAEEVLAAQKSHREYSKRLKVIQDRLEGERQAQFADAQKAVEALQASEAQRVLDVFPAWKDEAKREAGQKAVVEYALSLGFTKEQLRSVADHRLIVLLEKARRLDAMTSKPRTKELPRKGIRTATPGTTSAPRPRSAKDAEAVERATKTLAKSGRKQDAAKLLELRLG